ncbi:synaptic vesicle 2-related protein-like [Limulus polyphemus]|uniref:Synaptic vesicle 2-related protein-like n=1 Tax=Limulus polyphemus TaxID=6850 RepID=A0ABM1SSW1_LIMPO|nr:synaptic vesicle 2-related protein-like [Limulus polyphemus]
MANSGLEEVMQFAIGRLNRMLAKQKFPQNKRALRVVLEELLHLLIYIAESHDDLMSILEKQARMVLYMEYLPTKLRGKCTLVFFGFWGIGSLVLTLIAMVVMTTINSWRLVLFIAVMPLIIFLVLSKWCPESARYMLINGKAKEAEDIIIKIAAENGISRPSGKLKIPSDTAEKNSFLANMLKKENKSILKT